MYATFDLIEHFFYSQRGLITRKHYKHVEWFSENKNNLANSGIQCSYSEFLHHDIHNLNKVIILQYILSLHKDSFSQHQTLTAASFGLHHTV